MTATIGTVRMIAGVPTDETSLAIMPAAEALATNVAPVQRKLSVQVFQKLCSIFSALRAAARLELARYWTSAIIATAEINRPLTLLVRSDFRSGPKKYLRLATVRNVENAMTAALNTIVSLVLA